MKGIPYIHSQIKVYDARTFDAESFKKFIDGTFTTTIPIIHEFIYLTDFPKRIELRNNLEHNPYHLLFYMIAPFYFVDDGKTNIKYFYGKGENHSLSKEALQNLPERFEREYKKEQRIEYIQLPGCKWNIDWIDEPWIYNYIKNLYKHIWENTPQQKGKGIYISRNKSRVKQRAILNEDYLKPMLKGVCIEFWVLEDMSFIDTVRLFKSAKFVTGAHGAGLAWLVFCDPGTILLEIYKRKLLKEHYTYLCNSCNIKSFRFMNVIDDPDVKPPSDPNEVDDGHMIVDIPSYIKSIKEVWV